jgi:hypothetical protein
MNADSRIWKASDDEKAFGRRIQPHALTGLKVLFIPFFLSGIVLANGGALSASTNIDQNSILFWLWPFNRVYIHQFAGSSYSSSDIKWFFTVVSISNVIWLIFLAWKFVFELFRTDVEFPPGKMPVIYHAIVRVMAACCVILVLFIFVGFLGFNEQGYTGVFGFSLNQSITVGAVKVVTVMMSCLYMGAAFLLEFGGLGVRYFLSRTFGWFGAKKIDSPKG